MLSVLFTIAGLAGVGSLALLFWGLVTRNRRSLDGSGPRRHSPILVAGAALVIFACLTALLALAARGRHIQSFRALGGKPLSHAGATTAPLPFNATASFTTSGIVVGVVVLAVTMKLVRSMGWRRVLRRLHPLTAGADTASDEADAQRSESEALGMQLALVTVADPGTEPAPRRAVIGCYLQMLEVAARHGPERRDSETPTEYLRRMLASTAATATPAPSLTRLFERARYSQQPVGESMRFDAIAAIEALRNDLLAGTRLQAMPARRASLLSSDRSASEPRRPATSMRRFDPGSSRSRSRASRAGAWRCQTGSARWECSASTPTRSWTRTERRRQIVSSPAFPLTGCAGSSTASRRSGAARDDPPGRPRMPLTTDDVARTARDVVAEVESAVVGKREAIELVLIGVLAGATCSWRTCPGLQRRSSCVRSRESSASKPPGSSSRPTSCRRTSQVRESSTRDAVS